MKILAKTQYKKGWWLIFSTDSMNGVKPSFRATDNDIQVVLENDKGKRFDDAICHYGSYGVEKGLWEIMSESLPKNWGDGVRGHLTWKEIEKYFDKTIKKHSIK